LPGEENSNNDSNNGECDDEDISSMSSFSFKQKREANEPLNKSADRIGIMTNKIIIDSRRPKKRK